MDEREIREEYERIFDNIHASEELKNKILMQKKTKKHSFIPAAAALSTVAAAVIIFAAVGDYSFETDTSGVISEYTSQDRQVTDKPQFEPTESPQHQTLKTSKAIEEYKSEGLSDPVEHISRSKKSDINQSPELKADTAPVQTVQPDNITIAQSEITEKGSATAEDSAVRESEQTSDMSESQRTADATQAVRGYGNLLNINPLSVMPQTNEVAMAASYDVSIDEEYTIEEWDNDRYFNYIGTDILNDAELGEDLIYVGGNTSSFTVDSSGELLNDTRMFMFSGNNGRFAQIITSRDLTYANSAISADGITLSDINGTNAAVFAENGEYSVYMIHNGISYIINTSALTEEELYKLLVSLSD